MSSFSEDDAFEAAVPLSARAVAARPVPYLDDLNPAQREAVEALDGPVLMLAGAGTGKTKALTTRIAHLLNTGRARPNEILAVTFTNKAAREMKERVARLLGQTVEGMPWLGTFHAIGVKLLRRHAELVGLKSNFTILDTDDQVRLLKQIISVEGVDEKRHPPRWLASKIDGWKNQAFLPSKVPESEDIELWAERIFTTEKLESTDQVYEFKHRNPESGAIGRRTISAKQVYAIYQERLKALNAVDFGDLLLHVLSIFQTYPDVLAQYQRWFRYILVDEYQDTNVAQYLWLRLLAQGHRNICCVGDDDQSIYGWRGAEVGNILRFETDFPGAKVVRLEQNYRSTAHILAAASGVIAANEGRLGKELWTEAEGGEKVRLIGHWDGEEEARWIGDEIEAMGAGTRGMRACSLDDMAILVRASHQMRAFEDRFLTIGLPYRVIGGPRFYERMEIRDAMAYFRVAVSPEDDLAFERIVNTPKRGVGDKALQRIQRAARDQGVPLIEGVRRLVEAGEIKGKAKTELAALLNYLDLWNYLIVKKDNDAEISKWTGKNAEIEAEVQLILAKLEGLDAEKPSDEEAEKVEAKKQALAAQIEQLKSRMELFQKFIAILKGDHIRLAETILEDSGYTEMWRNDKTPEAPGRLENLKELVKALEGFENLQGFLEHVALIMDNESDDGGPKVSIMTLHAAKGLEFPAVFLPGWEDGLFPSQRSMDESGLKGLEEERRLAYVGITRAEELCTISFASNRRVYGQWQSQMPSRFIDELPEAHVEVLTPPGLYGGGYGAAGMASTIEDRAASANVYNSPGWKRMQSRGSVRGMSQPSESRNAVIDLDAVSFFTAGDRVFHQKFGYGTILGIEGDKLDIEFDKAGAKKVVAKFIVPAARADDVPF
ncbi:MAG: UvrD-helicase domain-containing protein [Rhodobacteraceae bacterium]|nr:UvrD-helicase domain-containing protein [Paracoccaceae bacterium]